MKKNKKYGEVLLNGLHDKHKDYYFISFDTGKFYNIKTGIFSTMYELSYIIEMSAYYDYI